MITIDQLTKGQFDSLQQAKILIQEATKNEGNWHQRTKHLTINGPAGTGKTTMMKFLVSWLRDEGIPGIALAAPTHQAKKILANMTGEEVSTIHSILKINPTTYEEKQFFEQSAPPDLSKIRVLICEECSFYDIKLFEILMNSIQPWTIIIGIGDKAQLRPADDSGVSRFFTDQRFEQAHLTEIKRSNMPIIEVATEIRNGGWVRENIVDGAGVKQDKSVSEFMVDYFKVVKKIDDLYETRMFAYTNNSVDTLNKIIRKTLYNTEDAFIVGEPIVMQEPLIRNINYEGKKFQEIVFNNGEYLEITEIKPLSTSLKCRNTEYKLNLNYFQLKVKSIDTGETGTINTISDKNELNNLYVFLGKVAQDYKSGTIKAFWDDFWKIKNNFHRVKPLPVSTIHKGQGSTVDNSFLYTPCITKYAEPDLASQLLYVGVTRARHNVNYVG
jgi:ATP-dependent exoDNAse (exonuclease V) alpha subunit